MLVDLAAYYEKWENPQLPTNIAGFFLDANGADAHIKGIEGQLRTLLPAGFDLSLNGAYTHTSFADTSTIIGFPEGMQVPDIPEWTASAVLQWKHDLANGLSLYGSLEDNYVGTRISEPVGVTATVLNINQVLVHLPSYNILNVRFGISGEANAGARRTASVFVNNVTNTQKLLDPQPNQGVQTAAFQRYTVNQPVTAGLDLTYRFH